MDKKRAAIVTTAGVGLLVSALALRTWHRRRKPGSLAIGKSALVDDKAANNGSHLPADRV